MFLVNLPSTNALPCHTASHFRFCSIEIWALNNWCFWNVVLEKTLERPLDCREVKPVDPNRNQPWIFIGRMDAKAEAPIPWPADVKSQVIGKDPDAGKDWRQEKGTKDNEMVGWHHQLNVHEFEQTLGDGKGQEAWHAAVHGVQREGHDLATEQQQCILLKYLVI